MKIYKFMKIKFRSAHVVPGKADLIAAIDAAYEAFPSFGKVLYAERLIRKFYVREGF